MNDSVSGWAAAFWTSSFQMNNYALLYCPGFIPKYSIIILCQHWPCPAPLLFENLKFYCDSYDCNNKSQMCVMLIHLSPSSASEEILRRCQISITGGPRWARVLRLEGPRPLLHHRRKGEGVEVRSQKRKRKNHPRNRRQGMPRRREVWLEQIADLKLGDLFDEAGGVYQSLDLIKSVHNCSQ